MNDKVLTLAEFCQITQLESAYVLELVSVGIIDTGSREGFDPEQMLRGIKAQRLQRDLELDLQGVALVLDLIEKNQAMRQRLQHLEQLLTRLDA
ncbi:MAG: chaperone modulatory protein CbpM [Cyclobacteriaceae bacterium]|jgi:chaperone modulatory protein CbpM